MKNRYIFELVHYIVSGKNSIRDRKWTPQKTQPKNTIHIKSHAPTLSDTPTDPSDATDHDKQGENAI